MRTTRYAAFLVVPLLIFLGIAVAQAQTPGEFDVLRGQVEQLFSQRKYTEALAAQRNLTAGLEKAERTEAGAPAQKTAEALGHLAWYALFARQYVNRRGIFTPDRRAIETPHIDGVERVGDRSCVA